MPATLSWPSSPTNGKVTGGRIKPYADLLAEFPYLGPPAAIPYERESRGIFVLEAVQLRLWRPGLRHIQPRRSGSS